MNKLFSISLLALLIFVSKVNSQTFTFSRVSPVVVYGDTSEYNVTTTKGVFKNTGTINLNFKLVRILNYLPGPTWISAMSVGNYVYSPYVDSIPPRGMPPITLPPGQQDTLIIDVMGQTVGAAKIVIQCYVNDNPAVSIVDTFRVALSTEAELISPSNNSINNPINLNLVWKKLQFSAEYNIILATDLSFTNIIIDTTLTDTTKHVAGLSNSIVYYWKVRGKSGMILYEFSNTWSFTTIISAPAGVPGLITPLNNSIILSLTPTLDWSDVATAIKYDVMVSTDSLYNTYTVFDSSTVSQYIIPDNKLTFNTKYYWKVRGRNIGGNGQWSAVWNFTTILQTPTLLSPTNGSTNVILNPLLDWSDITGATTYNVQIASNSNFTIMVSDLSGLTGSHYQVPTGILQGNSMYYWRASASNSNGTSSWTTVWNFMTLGIPNVPTLITPTNGSNIITLTPTLDWSDVIGTVSYTVQTSTDTNFINLVVNQSGLTASQYSIPSGILTGNITYYWRARSEAGPWSLRWYFRVVTIPPAPNLVAPLNNSTNQSPTALLDWDSLVTANLYRIQLATDSLFYSLIYDTIGVTCSSLQMRPGILLAGVKYFWKVNATNLAGTGSWSLVWNFRVTLTGIFQYSSEIQKEFKLYNNYPNPFNPVTKIRFDIPKNTHVKVSIFDVSGREINQPVNDFFPAGSYEFSWYANNLASGVYFYRIEAEDYKNVKKMLLVR